MTTLAIELNDAAIAVAGPGGLLAVEPGCAIETDGGLAFGGAARVLVNAQPAESGIQLACGDRLAIAGSTEAAQLIAVSDNGS